MTLTNGPTSALLDLTGKTALVTAAGQGLGRAVALRLADAGANIVVSTRRPEPGAAVAEEIRAAGGKAIAVINDVTNLSQIEPALDKATEAFGGVDILANVAGGIHPFTPFLELDETMWQDTMERNVKGSYFMTQAVAKRLVAAGKPGRIVTIGSTAAFRADDLMSAYNAAKAALVQFTRSVAVELAPHKILVNAVLPGPLRTTNTEWIYDDPKIAAQVAQKVPLGHPADPDDVANAVLFFAGRGAGHNTGTLLVVDGGFLCG
ncbi:SDR family NAD(P)-dependent oxidoreductase [Sphingobium sp. AN641]|uniref:SDR family NAD(P)-dependent oxidoreductase n=1 Tax=Sphingobium sp. AN641 TaxID=3133443 RepID=UPI0030C36A78